MPILAPEDLIVLKLLFNRHKDVVDIERIVAAGSALDWSYIRHWLIECVGKDDTRMATLGALRSDGAGSGGT